jgi:excisionase family DNA binding protein
MKRKQGTGKPPRKSKTKPAKPVIPPPQLNTEDRYRVREACTLLKNSHMTVYDLIHRRVLDSYKQGGTRWIRGYSIKKVIDGDFTPIKPALIGPESTEQGAP